MGKKKLYRDLLVLILKCVQKLPDEQVAKEVGIKVGSMRKILSNGANT